MAIGAQQATRGGRASRRRINALIGIAMVGLATAGAPAAAAGSESLVVDVMDAPYGATGDGVHNDRDAIQRAIDDVSQAGGGTVLIPIGHTMLSGDLALRDGVTVRIDGTLEQSQDPGDYTYTPVPGHTGNPWFENYPMIYAGNKHEVGVAGTGTMQMTQAPGGDRDTIHVVAIGFSHAKHFSISGVHILNGHGFNVQARESRHGIIRNLSINTHPSQDANGDGINVNSSQYVRITGNTIENTDDAILVGSSYGDPRGGTWWHSDSTTGGSQHIEIDHNVLNNKPVAFFPLADAPDERWTEIRDISIHDNFLPAGVHAYCSYLPGSHETAITHVRIYRNQYDGGRSDVNRFSGDVNPNNVNQIQCTRMTDLVDDFGKLSSPTFLNPGFERTGTAFWSTAGDAGAGEIGDPAAGPRDPQARAAAAGFANGSWYGYVNGPSPASSLSEGLGLSDAVRYRFQARVLTGGEPVRMFVLNTCTGRTIASRTAASTTPETVALDFTAEGTCGNYHVGFDRDGARGQDAHGWALVDDADLTVRDTVIDDRDPAFTYSGSWSAMTLRNPFADDYHQALAPAATATVAFTGSRGLLFGLRRSEQGEGDVYLDGVYERRVDFYNRAFVDHQEVFDTGPIADGPHTLTVVETGTHNPASRGDGIQLDALLVQP